MKISSLQELRDNAGSLLRSKDPVLVTHRERIAGILFPWPESRLPTEFKRELFSALSAEIEVQIKKRGLVEDEAMADFESWRKAKREARRRL